MRPDRHFPEYFPFDNSDAAYVCEEVWNEELDESNWCEQPAYWAYKPGLINSHDRDYNYSKINYLCDDCYYALTPKDDYAIVALMAHNQ